MAHKRKGTPRRAVGGWQIKKQKGDTNDVRDWAGLNDYLLENVMGKLTTLAECLNLRSVCMSWENIGAKFLERCDRGVPLFVKRGQNEVTIRNCYSFIGKSKFEIELPEAYERCIWGSFQDWLYLGKRVDFSLEISLLNPFSRKNILLPRTSLRCCLMVMSTVPSDQKCVCMLVFKTDIAFWTPGDQKWHTILPMPSKCFFDALYYGGCFYLLSDNEIVVIKEKDVVTGARPLTQSLRIKYPEGPKRRKPYLVESCGEILIICCFLYDDKNGRFALTSDLEAYRLDLEKMAWLKMENLENQILFLGRGCSRSFHAKDLGESLANNVYFISVRDCVPTNEWESYNLRNCYIDDWRVFSFQKKNHWSSSQTLVNFSAGVWLTAPLGWCLKQSLG